MLFKNEPGKGTNTLNWSSRYVGRYRVTNKYHSNYEIRGVYASKDAQTVHANCIKISVLRDDIAFPFNSAVTVASIELLSDRSLLRKSVHPVSKQTNESINFRIISKLVMIFTKFYVCNVTFKEDKETDNVK